MSPFRIAAVGGLFIIAIAAAAAAETPVPASVSVTIDNFTFGPESVTVAPGTRVTWTNRDDIPHTIVDAATPRSVKSPVLDTGETFDHTFSAAGTFHYFCSIHPHMQGTIIVK